MNKNKTWKDKLTIIRRALSLINEADKGQVARAFAESVPDLVLSFAGVYLAALVIDGVIQAKPLNYLLSAAAIVCSVELVALLAKYVINRWAECHKLQYVRNTRWFISRKVMTMDYAQVENIETRNKHQNASQYISYGSFGIPALVNQMVYLLHGIASIVLGVILVAPMLFSKPTVQDGFIGFVQSVWGLAAVVVVSAVLALIQAGVCTKRSAKLVDEIYSNEDRTQNGRLREFFNGFTIYDYRKGKEIRLYQEQALVLTKFWNASEFLVGLWRKCVRKLILNDGVSVAFSYFDQLLLYAFAILRAASGMLSVGEVVAFVMYFFKIRSGFFTTFSQINNIFSGIPFCEKVFDFLDIPDEKYKGTIPTEKRDDNEYEFEFKHVYFKYPDSEEYVLKDINLKWKIGEKMALVGKNGCGKSTLVKLLCRLYDPAEGEITLNGIDIRKYKYEDYMALFSVVFQDSRLFSFSLAENVAAETEYDTERVEDCLIRAGLGERLASLEKGIDTCLYKDFDEKGVEISGGEAQKVMLARAVYKGAPFIVLDEPTAALDPVSEHEVYTKFNGIVGTRTAIYISHRLSSCRFCDEITVMEDGRIVEKGSHEELLQQEGAYRELWMAQAEYYKDTAGELFA